VIELLPESPRGYSNLGGLYHLMGRSTEAIAMLEKSLAIEPTPDAASNLATIRFFSGSYADAARAFEQVVALGSSDFKLWYNLASAYYWAPGERGKARDAFQKTADLAEQALTINPRDPLLLVVLADTNAHLGQEARARSLASEALRLAPDDGEVLFRVACLYELLGERGRSLSFIERALQRGYSADAVARSPDLEAVRADPRFKALSRVGSDAE